MTDHAAATKELPKPKELLELRELAAQVFLAVKETFDVKDEHCFPLNDIDSGGAFLREPGEIAAFAMRKLQALRFAATPGIPTRNNVVVYLVADLNLTLTSLADRIRESKPAAFKTIINALLIMNQAAVKVSDMNGSDLVELI